MKFNLQQILREIEDDEEFDLSHQQNISQDEIANIFRKNQNQREVDKIFGSTQAQLKVENE